MAAKLVDVLDGEEAVFTYEVVLNGVNYQPAESEFVALAKQMALDDQLVPADRENSLKFRVR